MVTPGMPPSANLRSGNRKVLQLVLYLARERYRDPSIAITPMPEFMLTGSDVSVKRERKLFVMLDGKPLNSVIPVSSVWSSPNLMTTTVVFYLLTQTRNEEGILIPTSCKVLGVFQQ